MRPLFLLSLLSPLTLAAQISTLKCRLARPHGVFVDSDGAIYIGDSESHRVRIIRP